MILERIKQIVLLLLIVLTIYIFFLVFPFISNILKGIFSVSLPLLISFSIAFILNPIVTKIQKKVRRRGIAVFLVLVTLTALIVFLGYITIPKLVKEFSELIDNLPAILEQLKSIAINLSNNLSFLPANMVPSLDNLQLWTTSLIERVDNLPSKVLEVTSKSLSIIALIPISVIYFLLDYEKIISYIRDYLIDKGYIRLKNCLGEINEMMMNFFKGFLIVMVILSIVSCAALMIVDLDFALIFGIIIGITDFIPFVGPLIGGSFPIIYALLSTPIKALYVLISLIIIQTIESNFLTPFIQSRQVKLHPLIVIFSLLFFGKVFGFFGLIVAVPLATMIKIIFKYYPLELKKRKEKNA